jgi:ABC-type polysaccharide/polyol phosphate export permease
MLLHPARQIHRFRGLLWTLTARELKARYRGSALGFFWSLVNPLLLLAVYSLVFGLVFNPRVAATEPYALFLISGLFPWIWVSTSILEGTVSLTANAGLIRKAAFPAELLPVVSVLSNLVHFLLAVPILAAALLVGRLLGYPVGGPTFFLLPVVVALQLPLVAGLALGLAALNVHFKDVRDLTNNLLTLLFFLTPIIYALDAIGIRPLRLLIRANPFTPFTLAYQAVLFEGSLPSWQVVLHMAAVSAVVWAGGVWIFERLRETLVEAA